MAVELKWDLSRSYTKGRAEALKSRAPVQAKDQPQRTRREGGHGYEAMGWGMNQV